MVHAQEDVAEVQAAIRALDGELRSELAARSGLPEPTIETLTIRPRKSDIEVTRLALAWVAR